MKETTNSVKRIDNFEGYGNLFCVDESLEEINPTHTFKDKQPQALKILLEKEYKGIPITIGAMSTGNTAFSILDFAINFNKKYGNLITPVIFIPIGIEKKGYFGPDTIGRVVDSKKYISLLEKMALEAKGMIIHLDFGQPGKKSTSNYLSSLRLGKIAQQKELIKPTGLFLNITEGLETTTFLSNEQISTLSEQEYSKMQKLGIKAYEPVILRGLVDLKKKFKKSPKYIICQFGAGILFNEVKDFVKKKGMKTKVIPIAVGDPDSCAEKIYPSYWTVEPNKLRFGGTTKSRHDNSTIYGVEDWEIGIVLREIGKILDAEASGIAGFAILYRLQNIIPELNKEKDVVLTINTGNGIPNFMERK